MLGEKEQEIFSIWNILSLPVVQEFGLQNIFHACEIQKGNWDVVDVQNAILGLNEIYKLICEYQKKQSPSAPQ